MASKSIKGLTVEIGGDTTKLGQALEGVNKKSRDLGAELKQINGLLKMDPGNVDLLAQKQKVLADAVKTTAEKLETLRAAEKQVQEQFEKGEASEDQVRALQREIVATTKKLDNYEKAARETERALVGMGKESEEAKEGADKVKDGANKAEKALDEYADSANKAEQASEGLAKVGSAVGKGLAAVTGVLAAAGAAMVAAAEGSREYRTEMGKLDTAFTTAGHSAEAATKTYKSLQGVLGETDQAVEAANHLAKITDNEKDLEKWTDICTGVFATFGDSLPIEGLTEAANETAKLGKVTGPLADALNWAGVNEDEFNASLEACSNEQERQTLIMETLNGLYSDAATKYKETNAEVIRANEANEEWASVMAEVGGAVEPLLTDVKLLGASLVKDLVPGVNEVTTAFRGMLNGEEGAGDMLGEAVGDLLGDVISKAAELIPTILEVGLSLVVTLAETIVAELPNLVTTVAQVLVDNVPMLLDAAMTLLLAVVDAIGLILPPLAEALPSIVMTITQVLVDNLPLLLEGAMTLLMAVVDAVGLILPPLVSAIPQIVMALVDNLVAAIPDLITAAVTLLLAIVSAIPLFITQLLPYLPTIVDSIVSGLLGALPLLVDGAIQLFMAILSAIPEIQKALVENAPSIVSSLVEGLLSAIPELISAGGQLLSGLVKGLMDFDIIGAAKGVGDSVVKGFKKAFDINSPSRRLKKEIGRPAIEGVAEGIEENADLPIAAMEDLVDDMVDGAENLNGLTLERRVAHTFSAQGPVTTMDGLSAKLDQILTALKNGQVIMLDGKTLVGSTAGRYDQELGQRRVLAERGAL
jgi:phage-related minor tail protein